MKIDAHYYAVLGFCMACGFQKTIAYEIAYASQFVDDAKINHIVLSEPPPEGISFREIDGKPSFFNMATCHSYTRLKTFNYSAMIANTSAFHFVPGCEGRSFPKKLRCKENSPIIKRIFEDVLEDGDQIKLGIALHAYADTFSHQRFSGMLSKVNDINECKPEAKIPWTFSGLAARGVRWFTRDRFDKLFDSALPAYGHGQALEYPDLPFMTWSYYYDYSDEFSTAYKFSDKIQNTKRYTDAFKGITLYLLRFLDRHPKYREKDMDEDSLFSLFKILLKPGSNEQRIKNWKQFFVSEGYIDKREEYLNYSEERWLEKAFSNYNEKGFKQRKVEGVILSKEFAKSEWYRYYLGVHWYKDRFFRYCADAGLDIPR
jgi:hypothetical protein